MMNGRKNRKGAFVVPATMKAEQLLQIIESLYELSETRSQKINEHFFDTFDWRLFSKKYVLRRRGRTFFLHTIGGQNVIQEQGSNRKSFFPWDLEKCKLRDILQSVAAIRALLVIVLVKITRKNFDLRNKDKKAVLRIHIDDGQVIGNMLEKPLPRLIYLEGVKGYDKSFTKVCRILEEEGLQRLGKGSSLFQMALSTIDRRPLDYSSKFTITLEKEATVQDTVKAVCNNLLTAMEMNFDGVIGDIDSEFLHDFRIAVRRTRSLLSQMKKLLPVDTYRYFQDEFRWLGLITGPVRDLDVYLLKRDQYQSMLPVQLHKGLREFFVDLERRRKSKLLVMKKGLTSTRYEKLVNDWRSFLNDGVKEWPTRNLMCNPLAVKMIGKRFRRFVKDGGRITDQSPDEALHRLRIQGKKLRYMLEFFRSFFDPNDIDFFLKQLRKLQNNLGDFNDISVQQEMLIVFQDELTGRTRRSIGIAAALGGLISHLADEQVQIRHKFKKAYSRFTCEGNSEKFDNIFFSDNSEAVTAKR